VGGGGGGRFRACVGMGAVIGKVKGKKITEEECIRQLVVKLELDSCCSVKAGGEKRG